MRDINAYKSIYKELDSLKEHSKVMRDRVLKTIYNSQYSVDDFVKVIDSLDIIDKELNDLKVIENMRMNAAIAFEEGD